jgi:hypothetical protein
VPVFLRVARYGGALLLTAFAAGYLIWLPFRPSGATMPDFAAYYSAGRYWSHGGNPYSRGIWSVEKTLPGVNAGHEELLPFVGPPLSLPLWAALGELPYAVAATIWGAVLAVCAIVLIAVPVRLARRSIGGSAAVSLLMLTLVAGPIVTGISVGQAALPAAAAIDLAIVFAASRRWLLMALATMTAAMLKPNDALVIGGTIRELATLLVTGTSALVSALANVPFAGGFQGALGYLDVLAHQSASERLFAYQMTTTSIAYGLGINAHDAALTGGCLSVVALAALVAAIRFTRANVVDGAAIACALFPFIVPFVHEPDLTIVFLPALLVVLRTQGWTWVLGATGTVLLCVDAFAMGQGPLGLVFTVVTAAVACLQVAALARRGLRWERLVPLGIIPLLLVLGMFAPGAHLPMWPAALPEYVAVAPDATASAEWHDEIAASGLEEQRPWDSLLRLLTLCGCASIAFAMIRAAAPARERSTLRVMRIAPALDPDLEAYFDPAIRGDL